VDIEQYSCVGHHVIFVDETAAWVGSCAGTYVKADAFHITVMTVLWDMSQRRETGLA
jgi:hypothetical protein